MAASTISPEVAAETVTRLDIAGMDCGDCARTIQASLGQMPGVADASVNFARGAADVRHDPTQTDARALVQRVRSLGYKVDDPAEAAETLWIFEIGGMDCADCARTVEAGVRRLPGIETAVVSLAAGTMTVRPATGDAAPNRDRIESAVSEAGFVARLRSAGAPKVEAPRFWRQRRVAECAAAVALWLVGFVGGQGGVSDRVTVPAFLLAIIVAGYPAVRASWFAVKARRADMNLLMTVAAIGAVALGEWEEGATAIVLFAVGLTLQGLTIERTRHAIRALMALAPAEARVVRGTSERMLPVADVAIGELVLVYPGERVPVDGTVESGRSGVDQSPITGESIPVTVGVGSGVFAGGINGDGALEIRSNANASDTTLARIVHLVEASQASRAPAQAFVDRFAAIYTPLVIGAALLVGTIGPVVTGDVRDWVNRALILLVVACPCALVISTPVALVTAIGASSRRGVLFKGGAAIEALATVRTVAFDKTGTLTAGRPAVVRLASMGGMSEDDLLRRAAAVDQRATHPLARAIVAAAAERGLTLPEARETEGLPGLGARAILDGETVLVGSVRMFAPSHPNIAKLIDATIEVGQTGVIVGTASRIDGVIVLADTVRQQSRGTIAALKRLGIGPVMLSGDNRPTADRVGSAVGIADVRAGLLPAEKVAAVGDLKRVAPVAMVGDGVNDAPALAGATVGIAMGVGGADVALEAADVVLMRDDLSQLPVAIELARRTMGTIRQNIAASILVKAGFLVLTFAGVTNLWLAVLADTGMSMVVTLNALLLLRLGRHEH